MIKYLLLLIFIIFAFQFFCLKRSISIINELKTFLISFVFILILNIKFLDFNLIIFSIIFLYIHFCFLITIPGIKNLGPSLVLVNIISTNLTLNKDKIKKKFLKEKFVEKRIKENYEKKFIYKKKNILYLSKPGKIILKFFDIVKKIYKLNADIK